MKLSEDYVRDGVYWWQHTSAAKLHAIGQWLEAQSVRMKMQLREEGG